MSKTQMYVRDGSDSSQDPAAPPTQVAVKTSDSTALPDDCGQLVRMGDLRRLFGITRPTAYLLAKHGKIRTVSLPQPGHTHGARLVSLPSVRAYLRKLLEENDARTNQNATTL